MNIVICDDQESDALAAKEVIKQTAHEEFVFKAIEFQQRSY